MMDKEKLLLLLSELCDIQGSIDDYVWIGRMIKADEQRIKLREKMQEIINLFEMRAIDNRSASCVECGETEFDEDLYCLHCGRRNYHCHQAKPMDMDDIRKKVNDG